MNEIADVTVGVVIEMDKRRVAAVYGRQVVRELIEAGAKALGYSLDEAEIFGGNRDATYILKLEGSR